MSQEFRAICEDAVRSMLNRPGDEITRYRYRNRQAYHAEAVGLFAGPEIQDRSRIVTTDARDTVNWMKPGLMKTFMGTDNAVEFTATRQDKEAEAKEITEYINYVFRTKNPGFQIFEQWLTDALIEKVGFLKVWWEYENQDNRENYADLTADQIEALKLDEDVEFLGDPKPQPPVQLPPIMGPQGPIEQPPIELFSVSVKRTKRMGRACVVPCSPGEVRISRRARYSEPSSMDMIAHVFQKPRYEWQDMGYDLEGVSGGDEHSEAWADAFDGNGDMLYNTSGVVDDSMQLFEGIELYIRYDYDDDKITEWRKVLKIGGEYFENEKVDDHPFVWICPIPRPHTFYGECPVDYAIGPQLLATTMLRAAVDGAVLSVNPRTEVVEGMVNYEDLVDNAPGGVVRVKQMGQTREIVIPDTSAAAYQLIEHAEEWKENATGFTRYSQGTDANALNKTATGVSIITQKADMRMELISRNVAEGDKDLFRKLLKLIIENQDVRDIVKVAGEWTPIDPSMWTDQHEISINVGLGTGDRQGQQQKAQALLAAQLPLLQLGIVQPKNVQASFKQLVTAFDYPQPELYYNAGDIPQQQQQPNPDAIKAQQAQQAQQQDMRHAAAMAAAQHDADQQRFAQEQAIEQGKADREERLAMAKMQFDAQLRQYEIDAQNTLERYKIDKQSATSIEVAAIGAQAQAVKGDQSIEQATTVARTKAVAELHGQLLDHAHDAHMASAEHEAALELQERAPKTDE